MFRVTICFQRYIKHTLSNKRENVELTFLRSVTIVMQFKMVAGFSHLAIR